MRKLLLAFLVVALPVAALGQVRVGPSRPVVAEETCSAYIEEHEAWQTASLRYSTNGPPECTVDEQTYNATVRGWLQGRENAEGDLESLLLGRAVRYPWLSQYLARVASSEEWPENALVTKSMLLDCGDGGRRTNTRVGALLSQERFRSRLDEPFEGTPYRVLSVSVEKVLFDAAEAILGTGAGVERVPYDAQVWLVLGRRSEP